MMVKEGFIEAVKYIYENIPVQDRHREYLKLFDNKGKRFSFSVNESKEDWLENYNDKKFEPRINLIERLPNILTIEFDEPLLEKGMDPREASAETEKRLKKEGFAFIKTDHKGKCPYLWLEFTKPISDADAKKFLAWICPKNARIDLNFASSIKIFPIIFASHRRHPHNEEIVYFNEGSKIDFSKLKIPKNIQIDGKKEIKEGFEYETFEKKITFNYDALKPTEEISTLDKLEKVIVSNFPSVWFETKACLSLFACMSLKNLNGCPSLNLVGNPSGEKTTVTSFFYNHSQSYVSDDFTPKAFVSHATNVKEQELQKIDLLPKIKNKVLISPELAPLFEAPKDKLLENFSILTRVLDGEGLNRDSGTHGHRGYSGDYKFAWLGATTPLKANVWNVMGKIGNRLFFLNMRDKNRTDKDYVDMFRSKAYEEKIKICRGAVNSFLDIHYKKYPVRSLDWDAEQDIFILQEIIKYAQLLAKLRGTLMIWKEESGEYQHSFPIIEEPPRAINSLYNLAKGNALINGRTFLRSEDLEIVRAMTFSSMPHDRFQFLKLLTKYEGRLSTFTIEKELNCSDETARKTMNIFEILGIVTKKNLDFSGGRPMYYIEIKPEFADLLKHTQGLNGLEKPNPSQIRGVYDNFSAKDFVKDIKNDQKSQGTQGLNGLEKPNPSQTNPICCPICGSENCNREQDGSLYCFDCRHKEALK